MKKITSFVLVLAILIMAFYSMILIVAPPQKTEAMYVVPYLYIMGIMCEMCDGQHEFCCHQQCYKIYVAGKSTEDSQARMLYEECRESCTSYLDGYCD